MNPSHRRVVTEGILIYCAVIGAVPAMMFVVWVLT